MRLYLGVCACVRARVLLLLLLLLLLCVCYGVRVLLYSMRAAVCELAACCALLPDACVRAPVNSAKNKGELGWCRLAGTPPCIAPAPSSAYTQPTCMVCAAWR